MKPPPDTLKFAQLQAPDFRRLRFAACAALCSAAVLLIYFRTFGYEFVDFDDTLYIVNHPFISRGLTPDTFVWCWTAGLANAAELADYWVPITFLSRALDVSLYGMNAGGHHATNVILHIFNTVLVMAIAGKISGRPGAAFFAAMMFAVHPMSVESVAWVTARKDVLSLFFGLSSVLFWIRSGRSEMKNSVMKIFSVLLYLAAMMSKPMVVTVPALICIVQLLQAANNPKPKTTLIARLILEKWAFAVPLVFIAVLTIQGKSETFQWRGLQETIHTVAYFHNFMIVKFVLPFNLGLYGPGFSLETTTSAFLVSVLAALATGAAAFLIGKKIPVFFWGWLWFELAALPVFMGAAIPVESFEWPADRFTYLPYIGLMIAFSSVTNIKKLPVKAAAVFWIIGLMGLSCRQLPVWKDSVSLFSRAIEIEPENYLAYNNLGNYYLSNGNCETAVPLLKKSVELNPSYTRAWNNLGVCMQETGDYDAAESYYRMSLKTDPSNHKTLYNLANLEFAAGDYDNALRNYSQSLELYPEFYECRVNMGLAHLRTGNAGEAVSVFSEAVRMRPDRFQAVVGLSKALEAAGQSGQSGKVLENFLVNYPHNAEVWNELGHKYLNAGNFEGAIIVLKKSTELNPDNFTSLISLGDAYLRSGDAAAAAEWYAAAGKIRPESHLLKERLRMISAGSVDQGS